ncbi:MAG: hypothetical protein KDC24_01700 [Saprospiraceae bacterium]|nr:hypothetical protein [Saprospiraceae bacterium]
MHRSRIRKSLLIALTFASVLSYAYLNCCASVKNTILPGIETEKISIEEDNSLHLPDLKMVEHAIKIVREFIPAS